MKDDAQQQWLQSTQQFQQTMTDTWTNAFDSFKNMDLGQVGAKLMAPTTKPPQMSISPEKMQALQQQFMQDATELW
ncbi:MAG TPA: class I poly(R)-hydroxyalkanoic acid synthase, partial [Rhodoferax sp.]